MGVQLDELTRNAKSRASTPTDKTAVLLVIGKSDAGNSWIAFDVVLNFYSGVIGVWR